MTSNDHITIWVSVTNPVGHDPNVVTWSGPCPWPALPREGDLWECCYEMNGTSELRFGQTVFRGPGGQVDEAATVRATASANQVRHLIAVHRFAKDDA